MTIICNFTTTLPVSQGAIIKVKPLNLNQINTTYIQPSNLIPHFWNYKIVDKEGSPDLPCIMILSELFGWFRNLSQSKTYYSTGTALPELVEGKLAVSYEFLSDKLNFQKERIRRNLVKLEALGILSRDVKNIALENGSRIKQLYLSIDPEFFKSCFRNPDLDIRVGNSDSSYNNSFDFKRTPLLGGEHISKKNNNRSIKSNFLEKDFKDKDLQITDTKANQQKIDSSNLKEEGGVDKEITFDTKPLLQQRKQRQLEDFYPLSKEDCSVLQSSSEREFSLNAMNEILKNMSKRITNRFFYSKKGFLAYMSQVFRYEKRDAVKINNTSFRIRANLDEAEQDIQKQEKYLTELEYSLQVSPEWHLKKKLASVLERSKAYNLLTSYKQLEIEGGICRITLNKHIKLSETDKNIILSQVQATHEWVGEVGSSNNIIVVELDMPQNKINSLSNKLKNNDMQSTGIWGKIRTLFAKSFGKEGNAIDRNWISKLEAETDEATKIVNLQAPGEFIKDFIEERYLYQISKIINNMGFKLGKFTCKENSQIVRS
jgi:hypothetical protein